jgi:N-acetylmuramoyl-L-alanine amidase
MAIVPFALIVVLAGVMRSPFSRRASPAVEAARQISTSLSTHSMAGSPSLTAEPISPDVLALSVRRVVIDAGHGGDNLGTSDGGTLLEKDLTLDIADRVRQLVVKRRFEAIMTRTSDEMVSLGDRAAMANGQRGDIFVSIHLNSLRPSRICGIETFYLGPSNDPERDEIAARENTQSGYSFADMQLLLRRIYADARRGESKRLAEAVQRALVWRLRIVDPALTDRGVKMAPFVVLVATEMPAVLAEVSCLSNRAEAQRLSSIWYRQTIAEAILSGIEAFAAKPTATQ